MNKTETKSTVLLKHHLKALKLPTMHAECEKIAQRCAADNADHLAFLLQLCELELIERERKAAERRLKAARFPAAKLLDEFDFAARPSVNKPLAAGTGQGRVSRPAREHPAGRSLRHRQVAPGHGAGHGRLRPGPQGPLLPRDRADHAAAGGQGRTTTLATAAATWQAGPVDPRRTGLRAGQQGRSGTACST